MFYCQEIAASFSGGGARGIENGPAFVPGEICRIFRSAGEQLLHHVGINSFLHFELYLKVGLILELWDVFYPVSVDQFGKF